MKRHLTVKLLLFLSLALAFETGFAQNAVAPQKESNKSGLQQSDSANDEAAPVDEVKGAVSGPVFHTVTEGETIASIIRQFGITMEDFKGWNYLPNGIKPGMRVVVKYNWANKNQQEEKTAVPPVDNKANAGTNYHTVLAGETLYHLSVVYHVTVQQLKEWNNLSDNTVAVGQKLKVGK